MQTPSEVFKELCQLILGSLAKRSMLVIVDDVWEADFECFMHDGLTLMTMQCGSCCIMTSRHVKLSTTWTSAKHIKLTRDSNKGNTMRILQAYVFQPEHRPSEAVMVRSLSHLTPEMQQIDLSLFTSFSLLWSPFQHKAARIGVAEFEATWKVADRIAMNKASHLLGAHCCGVPIGVYIRCIDSVYPTTDVNNL